MNTSTRKTLLLILIMAGLVVAVSCRKSDQTPSPQDETAAQIELIIDPQQPVVGTSSLTINVKDGGGNPLQGVNITLRGDMAHAGMTPVLAGGVTDVNGMLQTDFTWTMAGDWIVTAEAVLPDGRTTIQEFDLGVSP